MMGSSLVGIYSMLDTFLSLVSYFLRPKSIYLVFHNTGLKSYVKMMSSQIAENLTRKMTEFPLSCCLSPLPLIFLALSTWSPDHNPLFLGWRGGSTPGTLSCVCKRPQRPSQTGGSPKWLMVNYASRGRGTLEVVLAQKPLAGPGTPAALHRQRGSSTRLGIELLVGQVPAAHSWCTNQGAWPNIASIDLSYYFILFIII